MRVIEQNILDVKEGIIVHQVNCVGAIGGLAKAIFDKWPTAKRDYLSYVNMGSHRICDEFSGMLGDMQHIIINSYRSDIAGGLSLVNLYAQDNISYNKRATNYAAFGSGLIKLYSLSSVYDYKPIHFPYKIGCGLGGGDWNIISAMIDDIFPEAIICEF